MNEKQRILLAEHEESLTYWRHEAAQNERYLRGLHWLPLVGLPAALAVGSFHLLLGVLTGATAALTYVMGLYMTVVRRYEFAGYVREAEEKLAKAQRDADQPAAN